MAAQAVEVRSTRPSLRERLDLGSGLARYFLVLPTIIMILAVAAYPILNSIWLSFLSPPHQRSQKPRPKEWRGFLAGLRQIVETIYDKLLNTFRLARERPHDLAGFQARLAAKVSLHNFCIWFNLQLGRQPLAFADLLD